MKMSMARFELNQLYPIQAEAIGKLGLPNGDSGCGNDWTVPMMLVVSLQVMP